MQRLGLNQSLQQKLSPQQIQFIKLLQVPTAELETRIEEELEINPALEEGEDSEPERAEETSNNEEDYPESEESPSNADDTGGSEEDYPEGESPASSNEDVDIQDYLRDDDYSGYKMQGDGDDDEERDMPLPMSTSLHEQLMDQLDFLGLTGTEYLIGKQLVGSIE